MKKIEIDLNDLRSEYESSYLAYVPKKIKERGGHFSFSEWAEKEKGLDVTVFDVAVFDSEDDSNADVIEGSLPWDKASKLAQKLFASGKYYGVEIIDCDPDNMEPIVWIETKK
jgi:hypothetical protein